MRSTIADSDAGGSILYAPTSEAWIEDALAHSLRDIDGVKGLDRSSAEEGVQNFIHSHLHVATTT